VAEAFAAVQAAHEAIPGDRVITSLEVDEDRRRPQQMRERVTAVERELGRRPGNRDSRPRDSRPRPVSRQRASRPVEPLQ
jgi:hypothetical protein